jgi:general stress protein 26
MKTEAEQLDLVWKLAHDMRTCMFTTWDGKQQNARPMASHVFRDRHAIYFLTNADSPKEQELAKFPEASLIYMDTGANKYLKIYGRTQSRDDRALIRELWSPFAKAWWDSPDDPNIRVIVFTPESAEYWDSPNALIAVPIMLMNAAGAKISLGESAKVKIA